MFKFYKEESDFSGFNIARADISCLEKPIQLLKELKRKKIDVIKLSCRNPSSDLYFKLNSLGLDYYILSITQEYKSIFSKNPKQKEYLHPKLIFEEYTLKNSEILESLVKEIFKNNANSYFKNPLLNDILDEKRSLEILAKYVSSYCKEIDPNKYTHIMYERKKPIGFITSFKEDDGGGVLYAGILDQYVGKGYYLDLVRFIQNYGKSIGQKWGLAYAQIHHNTIHKTFIKEGLRPQGYILNVHLNCCFGKLNSHLK